MTDPAAIAARLTEAQKLALDLKRAGWSARCGRRDFWRLHVLGLIFLDWLTPLGRAVLAEIDKEPRHG